MIKNFQIKKIIPLILLISLVGFSYISTVISAPVQDDVAGYWEDDFSDDLGIDWDNSSQIAVKAGEATISQWTKEYVESWFFGGMRSVSITADSNNNPFISYPDEGIEYATRSGIWNNYTVESGSFNYSEIVLDNFNHMHISYYDSVNRDLKYAHDSNGDGDFSDSGEIVIVDSEGYVGDYSSIAVDSSGYPHISYYDITNRDLKYAYDSNGDGVFETITTVDSVGSKGKYNSIAVDSSGYPHISYHDGSSYNLKYAKYNGSFWEKYIVDSGGYLPKGYWTSIALDTNNHPHISYAEVDISNEGYLKYAYDSNGDGVFETITRIDGAVNEIVWDTAIALDSFNNPYFTYTVQDKNDGFNYLKYADWNGSSWDTEDLYKSPWANSSSSTDITFDNNNIHIAFSNKEGWYGSVMYFTNAFDISSGTIVSVQINPTDLVSWDHFFKNDTVPANTSITYSILDGSDLSVIKNNVMNGEDISDINVSSHPTIRLKANFLTTVFPVVPILDYWKVEWETSFSDTTPPVTILDEYFPDPTNDNTPTYTGTSTDTESNVVDIEYRIDAGVWIDVDAFTPAGSVNFNFTTAVLADGAYTFEVRSKDTDDNWELALYSSDTLTITIDTAPPEISNPQPSGIINNNIPNISVDTNENAVCKYDIVDQSYDFMANTFSTTGGLNHSSSIGPLIPDASHTYYVRCEDEATNQNISSILIDFVVDTIPPEISNPQPSGIINNNIPNISVDTNENAVCKYDIVDQDYNSMANIFSTTGGLNHFSSIGPLIPDASHTYYVRCEDDATNQNISSEKIEFVVDTLSPGVTIIACNMDKNDVIGDFCDINYGTGDIVADGSDIKKGEAVKLVSQASDGTGLYNHKIFYELNSGGMATALNCEDINSDSWCDHDPSMSIGLINVDIGAFNVYDIVGYKASATDNVAPPHTGCDKSDCYDFYSFNVPNTPPTVTTNSPNMPDYCESTPEAITLSWDFDDEEDCGLGGNGCVQTGYQLEVTRSDGVIYDSDLVFGSAKGLTAGDINIAAEVAGLGSQFIWYGYDYDWRVRVWDSPPPIWEGDYNYRKKLTINGAAGAGANYQVRLKVGETSGASGEDFDLGDNAQVFPDDIRFTDADGTTQLDYWLEEVSGASPNRVAFFWVEVRDDLNIDTDIYIYYGKSGDSSATNGGNTFLFFDDFNDGDASGWTEHNGIWSVVNFDGSYRYYQSANDGTYLRTSNGSSWTDYVLETKIRIASGGSTGGFAGALVRFQDIDNHYAAILDDRDDDSIWIRHWVSGSGSGSEWTDVGINRDTWYDLRVDVFDEGANDKIKVYFGGIIHERIYADYATGPIALVMHGTQAYYDDIRVRKFNITEPAFSSASTADILNVGDVSLWDDGDNFVLPAHRYPNNTFTCDGVDCADISPVYGVNIQFYNDPDPESEPDRYIPYTWIWDFDDRSPTPPNSQDPIYAFGSYDVKDQYTVNLQIIDGSGFACPFSENIDFTTSPIWRESIPR